MAFRSNALKMIIYRSKFQIVEYDEDASMLRETFSRATANYDVESFKNDFDALTEAVLKFKGKVLSQCLLIDMRSFLYSVLPDLKSWHKEHVYPGIIEMGIREMAVINTPYVFGSVSAAQVFEQYKDSIPEILIFCDENSALEWLSE